MRVVVVHAPGSAVRDIRQVILGSGAECTSEDCVSPGDLAARLAQVPAQLVVIKMEPSGLDIARIQDALSVAAAPRVAVGNDSPQERIAAQQLECSEFILASEVRPGLETVIHRLIGQGVTPRPRGTVVSVFAPLPGSGGTTVASNLAGAFAA